jgi:hypothetical protein
VKSDVLDIPEDLGVFRQITQNFSKLESEVSLLP